jgi:tripartite-type tricarboxylate transporter receptor subunit TctC
VGWIAYRGGVTIFLRRIRCKYWRQKMKRRQAIQLIPMGLISSAFVSPIAAQSETDFPSRPVRLVVGYAPGGTTDIIARLIARELSRELGQSFVVDNRPGANSNLGTEVVVRSAPDGYNLLLGTISNATNATMYKNASFDVTRDLVPVASIGLVPNVLVVPATSAIKTFDEYLAFARANPGKMTFASAGSGSSIHLSGELFKSMAKVDMLHVPYRGSAPAINDLIAGQVGSMFDNLPSSLPQIQGGKLIALAVTSPARAPSLPNVPTVAEKGLQGFEAYSWTGLMAPRGTSPAIVAKLSAAVERALKEPSLIAQMEKIGASPKPAGPEEFSKFVDAEVRKWSAVIQKSGAKID